MTEVKYYRDERGNFPAREFINDPHNGRIKNNMKAAIAALQINGLNLMGTKKMSFIGDRDDGGPRIQGLYELRNESQYITIRPLGNLFYFVAGARTSSVNQLIFYMHRECKKSM